MKKTIFLHSRFAGAIILLAVLFFSCKKNNDTVATPSPNITGVTAPGGISAGPKNTVITIKGSNFITDLSKIQVTVNGKSCVVLSATPDSVKAKIPPY